MAEELLETVERLQSRLLDNPEPRKLLKTLKRLLELPMTVDILVETGVGKTVNSFRKHDFAGEVAKNLVAKWKKLVPQSADRPSQPAREAPRPHARSRGAEDSSGGALRKRTRDPSPPEDEEEEEEPSYAEEQEEDEEQRVYGAGYSHQNYSPRQRGGGGGYRSEGYDSPSPSPPPAPPPPPPPQRKEAGRHSKPHKEPAKNHNQQQQHHHGSGSSHGDRNRDEERRQRHSQTSGVDGVGGGGGGPGGGGGGGGGGSREGKKRDSEAEQQQHSSPQKAAKHSRTPSTQDSKREKEGKRQSNDGRPRAPKDPADEEEEAFEVPTMSFESFLNYDSIPISIKKKKKQSSSSHSRTSGSSSHRASRVPPPVSSTTSSSPPPVPPAKAGKTNGTKSGKRAPSGSARAAAAATAATAMAVAPEKRRKVVETIALLTDIPLPAIQPNYRPLPSIDLTPLSPQRRKVPVSNDEEDAGFTGKRFNSKMTVYSGSKTAYLPKMMTLYEQCIRVLQNNIDSIDEVGGVPFEILEPVLERCTPEQLYRIEQCNQCFTEESDELWMRHCQRDFKRQAPQEYESWREMYLRLHDEREERLRMLTQNISSAHANKPKGRQVKMAFVNSVAKPPRDVRRRQEKFGTTSGSSAASSTAAAPIKIRPAGMYHSSATELGQPSSSSSQNSPPHGSSSRLSVAGGGIAGGGLTPRDNKPQVKKIAPMMAKTIKAFKNRFSRR